MGLKGAKLLRLFLVVFPVGVKVTEGLDLALEDAKANEDAEVMVVEPFAKVKLGLFSFPGTGVQVEQ